MFSYSSDEENFHGEFATREEAAAEAAETYPRFWTGENREPSSPETFWRADDWLEHVSCSEEYSCEWAEGWDTSTNANHKELEELVRPIMLAWLERNNLKPKFFNVDNVQEHDRVLT